MLLNALSGFGAGGDYRANGVVFDGTNDYLSRGAGLTGDADTKQITFSFWARIVGTGSPTDWFFEALFGTYRARVLQTSTKLDYDFRSAGGVTRLRMNSGATVLNDSVWRHHLVSWDLTDTGKRHYYLNDADASPTWSVYTNIDLELGATTEWALGATTGGGGHMQFDCADFWFDLGTYIDFSVEANRRDFINSAGKPVYLGATGELPTGTAPIIFFSGSTDAWHTNKGTGGGFTENGALSTAASSPSE